MIRTYTLTKRKSLLALYKCESCGQINIQQVILESKSQYDDTSFTNAGRERKHDRKEAALSQKMDKVYEQLLSGGKNSVYPKAQLNCKCPKCQKKQSWSRMSYGLAKCGIPLLIILAVMVYLILQQRNLSFDLWRILFHVQPILNIALIVSVLAFIIHYAVMMLRLKKNADTCPPLFALTVDGLKEKAANYPEYASVDWEKYRK